MQQIGTVIDGLISDKEVKRELRQRKTKLIFQSIPNSQVDVYINDGWSVVRKNKTKTRISHPKQPGQALEDEIWTLLANMGFDEMNSGRTFRINIGKGDIQVPPRQIDVFAKDECSVIIVECKEANKPTRRSLQKEIAELSDLRQSVITTIHQHYGNNPKLKVALVLATKNIILSDNDKDRATDSSIIILSDEDIEYFESLTDHIGIAARYQFLAELFSGQKIPGLSLTVPALRGKMGDKYFYSFLIDPTHLLRIAFVSHRAKTDKEVLVSYQRMLKKSRLKEIAQFINNKGVFPTSIVISLRSKSGLQFDKMPAEYSSGLDLGHIHLPSLYKSAWIIDGQHRLYGYAASNWAESSLIPVIAFENLHASEEAKMFQDINHEQVKVPKNLLVELAADLHWDSPNDEDQLYALESKVASHLGSSIKSPLFGRMASEAKKRAPERPVNLTAMYEAIRRSKLLGTVVKGRLHPGPLYDFDSFSSLKRAVDVFAGFLNIFSTSLPEHWALGSADGGFLCTNNGVTALFHLLAAIITYLDRFSQEKPKDMSAEKLLGKIEPFLKPVIDYFQSATLVEIKDLRRLSLGSTGPKNQAYEMMLLIKQHKSTFFCDGLEEYTKKKDTTGTDEARLLMPTIQLLIRDIAVRKLKEKFGNDFDSWWAGVPQNIRIEVAGRREASEERGPMESFFELIDYKKIAASNWILFQQVFSFGDGRSKDDLLRWYDRLNGIRNRIAHPERGAITPEEVEFLKAIQGHLERTSITMISSLDINGILGSV